MTLTDELNSHRMLFLRSLSERDGSLTVEVCGAVSRPPSAEETASCPILRGAEAVEPDDDSVYRIEFRRYIAYNVSNESYASPDDSERFTGRLFREYSSSRYANYIGKTTFAEQVLGKLTHYGICCGDHIIDVITDQPPVITKI